MFGKENLLDILNKIEGHKTRMKELHWSSPSHSLHIIIDEYSGAFAEFEDAITENATPLLGFVRAGELNPVLPEETEFEAQLEAIRGILSVMKTMCGEDNMWSGLVNLIDDFWTTTNRYIYLAKICKHEAAE